MEKGSKGTSKEFDYNNRYKSNLGDYSIIDFETNTMHLMKLDFSTLPDKEVYSSRDAFMLYHKSTRPKKKPLSKFNYMLIVKTFVDVLFSLLTKGFKVNMPFRLGALGIVSKSHSVKGIVDWQRTKKLWREYPEEKENKTIIYNLNEHSDGKSYRVSWLNRYGFANKEVYNLLLGKSFKARLASLIKEGWSNEYKKR